MKHTGCLKCVRYILCAYNFLLAMSGIIVTLAGIIVIKKIYKGDGIYDAYTSTFLPYFLIVMGTIIFFISLLGCCTVAVPSKCFIRLYATSLFGLAIVQVITIFIIRSYGQSMLSDADKGFSEIWSNRDQSAQLIETMQQGLECCGSDSPLDYGNSLPSSCCKDYQCTDRSVFNIGCKPQIMEILQRSTMIVITFLWFFSAVEIFGICLSCCWIHAAKSKSRR